MKVGIAGAQHFHVFDMLESVKKIKSVKDLEIVGIYDSDPKIRQGIAEKYQILPYDSLNQLLDTGKPDAVVCFDIPSLRANTIITCLEKGISILSDKPPALNKEQLSAISSILKRNQINSGVKRPFFSIMLSERYNPPVITLKKVVESGIIGEIVNFNALRPHKLKKATRPGWMFQRETYGGILVDLAVHDLDVFQWLTGARPVEITAYSSNYTCPEYPEFEDNGQMLFKAENGSTGFIKVEWLAPEAHPSHGDCRYFLTGTKGSIEVKTEGDLSAKGGKVILCGTEIPPTEIELESVKTDIYLDFFTAVEENRADFEQIPVQAVLNVMTAVLAARESADRGEKVVLQWEEEWNGQK